MRGAHGPWEIHSSSSRTALDGTASWSQQARPGQAQIKVSGKP